MPTPADTPSTDGAPDPKHTISLANIDRGTPEWRLRCHHGADEFRCYTETGEVDPLREGQCVLMDWWGEYGIELVDIREAIPALPIAVEADWNGDSWDLTLAAAGLRVVPEDRPARWQDLLHDRPSDGKECGYTAVSMPGGGLICTKCGWAAAGVPALDDDTRREVEALIVMLTQNSFHLTQTEMNRIAELLAAAYLGGTEHG